MENEDDYQDFPAGLKRRLLYGQYIRTKHQILYYFGKIISENGATLSQLVESTKIRKEHIECSICINIDIRKTFVRQLKCKHIFHIKCIDYWLIRNATCPVCRSSVK